MGPWPFRVFCFAACLLTALSLPVHGQTFGRNKVQYDRVDFRVLATPHFDVYHAQEDAAAAQIAAALAERWYERLSRVLEHELSGRQPVILYGSHRGFEQTNVTAAFIDESTGGFTESRKRRIVLPFGPSLAATDHVLGHEIVHAFQYDIAARHRATINLPLWLIEGMAEYLSLGPDDALTAMWMRDATRQEKLPAIRDLDSRHFFPYRYGAALWSYLHHRYGEKLAGRILKVRGSALHRLETLTGVPVAQLSDAWHAALRQQHGPATAGRPAETREAVISRSRGGGRLNLGASLSPDGRHVVFLSERDQLSVDVFLADAKSGAVIRKLLTTAATASFESLQYLHSSGTWDPAGRYFALATVRQGRPTLTILDTASRGGARTIPLPQLGEIFGPTWSPDGSAIAVSAMRGGVSDLYVVDVEHGTFRQLTDDPYADLQPAWSPDGRTIAFVSERFTSDVSALHFGPYAIGLYDVESGAIRQAPGLGHTRHINPVWSADASSLFVVADHEGVGNVFRLHLHGGGAFRVTDVETGVGGLTRLSPALSMARDTGALSFTVYRNGAYEVHVLNAPQELAGVRLESLPLRPVAPLVAAHPVPAKEAHPEGHGTPQSPRSTFGAAGGAAARADGGSGDVEPTKKRFRSVPYRSTMSLEAMGQPYFSAGGGPFGNHVRGGMSFLFGDLLGNRQLFTSLDVSSRLGESAVQALYIDRQSRWNWGAVIDQVPEIWMRRWQDVRETGDRIALTREQERRTHRRLAGFVAYPFDRATRLELNAAIRNISFHTETNTRIFALPSGRLQDEVRETLPGVPSLTLGEAGVALVRDTAIFGATGPILGTRLRLQLAPTFGELAYTHVLADYRRYVMPVRPFTLAFRLFHSARYGADADDPRLREAFLGSTALVRGYGAGAISRSQCRDTTVECPALEHLIGTRILVGKLELRFPLLGALSSRIRYGPVPVDAVLFADAGTVWGGRSTVVAERFGRAALRSAGAGVRVNAIGIVLEFDAVRPFDLPSRGWTFAFNVRPGF